MALPEMLTSREGLLPPKRGKNPNKLSGEFVTQILDKWWRIGELTPVEERDQVGKTYISVYLELGDEIAEAFSSLSQNAFSIVGKAQRECKQEDTKPFWNGITELFPDLHTPGEIDYLTTGSSLAKRNAVLRFMKTFETEDLTQEPSRVLRDLTRNEGT